MLCIPLKKTNDIDLSKPLKHAITRIYGNSDKPEGLNDSVAELNKLRSNAVWKALDKHETSLEIIYRYYDQINSLESKIPASEIQIPFKWKDAFDKGSLFGGKLSLTVTSLSYEKMCILFDIAALHSQIAFGQNFESDEGLKLAAKLLQQASGIFSHIKSHIMSAIQQEPTPDLNPDTLSALSALCLAQAQESFVLKAINDRMKDSVTARLCAGCSELYEEAMKLMSKENIRHIWERDWLQVVSCKMTGYRGLAEFYQSVVLGKDKHVGEQIARLQSSVDLFKQCEVKAPQLTSFSDYLNRSNRILAEAKKDNDFIYHEKIPDFRSLEPVNKAQVAKVLPVADVMSQNFTDLFSTLTPMQVQHGVQIYEDRKAQIVNNEVGKLRSATQVLCELLASMNLPAALENDTGESVPPSIMEKANAVRSMGGIAKLQDMLENLPSLLQRNEEILNETAQQLENEKSADSNLREQFGARWSRLPSEKLTSSFNTNIMKYRQLIHNAVEADKTVRTKFGDHMSAIELLSGSDDNLGNSIPSVGGSDDLSGVPGVKQLRDCMEKVDAIKNEREVIESEMKNASADIKSAFLNALSQDGALNEQVTCEEMLQNTYGSLQEQVNDSLQRQEALVHEIKISNDLFTSHKCDSGCAAERDSILMRLASAHDSFKELMSNLEEGTKFYSDLTQVLLSFQTKVTDYCFARKTEKEELMKDLTENLSQGTGQTPNTPAHHNGGKQPPARPPPPATGGMAPAPNLPYPVQNQGMPVPFAFQAQPYPAFTPMPAGYNPYTMYAPPQQQQQQQQQPGNYQYFPPYPGQVPYQYPGQHPH